MGDHRKLKIKIRYGFCFLWVEQQNLFIACNNNHVTKDLQPIGSPIASSL